MIVPHQRLLVWTALIGLPCSVLAGMAPSAKGLCLGMVGGFVSLALLDAVLGSRRLARIEVRLPKTSRMTRSRQGLLEVEIRNLTKQSLHLRIGVPLPSAFEIEQDRIETLLPKGQEFSRVAWPCHPLERGQFLLESCRLERDSPCGFWCHRQSQSQHCEIRVYPNLLSERRHLASIFLNKGLLGLHPLRQVGQGKEFEKLREYVPGDSFDDIHWKATAKRGRPITKEFQIEKTQEVYVVLDASRLSARPCRSAEDTDTILDRYIASALLLGLVAERQGDLFGLLTFGDRVNRFVRAKSGKTHFDSCRDALYTLQARPISPDFDEVCTFIRLRLRRRALVVFLTHLEDPVLTESFVRNMNLISRQHLVLVNMLHPAGAAPLFQGDPVQKLDHLYEHLAGHFQWQNLRELEKLLDRHGVRFHLLKNDLMCLELVQQYINVKRRQIL